MKSQYNFKGTCNNLKKSLNAYYLFRYFNYSLKAKAHLNYKLTISNSHQRFNKNLFDYFVY